MVYPVYVSNEKFQNFTDLLMIRDENNSYVYIKHFNSLNVIRQKIIINTFANIVYNVLLVRNMFENKWQTNCKIKKWFNWI